MTVTIEVDVQPDLTYPDIWYTIDGTTPTTSNGTYETGPNTSFDVSGTTTVKAIAIYDGMTSAVASLDVVFEAAGSGATQLTVDGTFMTYTIGTDEVLWYYFDGVAGNEYRIFWDDYDGPSGYTADVVAAALREDQTTEYFADNHFGDSTTVPSKAVVIATGESRVYVRITEKYASSNFTIKVESVGTSTTPSSDATLSDLTVSDGILDPTFSSSTTSYTVDVENAVTSIGISPTTTDSNATYELQKSSSTVSSPVPLDEGSNDIAVVVTAEDGTTTQTYNVTVTRATTGTGGTGTYVALQTDGSSDVVTDTTGIATLYYEFTAQISATYQVQSQWSDPYDYGSNDMSVYDSSGNLLSSQTATAYDDGILQITATAGSLYQIEVSGWNEYATEVTTSVSEPVSFISMGQGSAFVGVDPFGRIWAKGTDYDGTGTGGGDASSLQIVKDDVEFTAVSHGPRGHSLALDAAGNIWSTGDNGNGKLGIGESASTTSWTVSWQAATSGTTFVRIFAGENNSFAVDSAGVLWVAGYDPSTNGDVLDFTQTTVSDSSGQQVEFVDVSSMAQGAIAIDTAGNLWAVGTNPSTDYSVFGSGADEDFAQWTKLNTGTLSFHAVEMSSADVTYAIEQNGTLYYTGMARSDVGTSTSVYSWEMLTATASYQFEFLTAESWNFLAIDVDGDLWGVGSAMTSSWTELLSGKNLTHASQAYSTSWYSFAVGSDGLMYRGGSDGTGWVEMPVYY